MPPFFVDETSINLYVAGMSKLKPLVAVQYTTDNVVKHWTPLLDPFPPHQAIDIVTALLVETMMRVPKRMRNQLVNKVVDEIEAKMAEADAATKLS